MEALRCTRVWHRCCFAARRAVSAARRIRRSPETLRAAQELASIVTVDTMKQMTDIMTSQMWPQVEAQFDGKVDGATLAELRARI